MENTMEKIINMENMEELVLAMAEIVKENRRLRSKLEQLTKKETGHLMEKHIDFLELPNYINNALLRSKIDTIEKLCNKKYAEIRHIRCMGDNSMKTLQDKMDVYGLHFADRN